MPISSHLWPFHIIFNVHTEQNAVDAFPNLWIGIDGSVVWSPRSAVLTPLDFSIWWYEKHCLCCNSHAGHASQSFSGPRSSVELATMSYCLRFETSVFVARYDSQGYGAGIRPHLHTGDINISLTAATYIPDTRLYHWEITGKAYNKNCKKACMHLKLRWKRRWKYYATNQVHENQYIGLLGERHEANFCLLLVSSVE
jgi:hypothetical protein